MNWNGGFEFEGSYLTKNSKKLLFSSISGLFDDYCKFVELIKPDADLYNLFINKEYKEVSEKIKDKKVEYGKVLFSIIGNKEAEIERGLKFINKEEVLINKEEFFLFIDNFQDLENFEEITYIKEIIQSLVIEKQKIINKFNVSQISFVIQEAKEACYNAKKKGRQKSI